MSSNDSKVTPAAVPAAAPVPAPPVLSDAQLTEKEQLAAALPQGFAMRSVEASSTTVTVTFEFDTPKGPLDRAEDVRRLLDAASALGVVCRGLRAERGVKS